MVHSAQALFFSKSGATVSKSNGGVDSIQNLVNFMAMIPREAAGYGLLVGFSLNFEERPFYPERHGEAGV